MEKKKLIIVGAGPAGLSAALYALRYNIDFEIIGRIPGGVMTEAHDVENYPGVGKVTGNELAEKMVAQLKEFGKEIIADNIKSITKEVGGFKLVGQKEYSAKTILLAIGTERNKLNIPGEKELCGKGVSYCATCDGFFYRGKTVAVVGGGDAALGAADYLSNIAEKVYLIHRRDEFRASPFWQDKTKQNSKIEALMSANVVEIAGTEKVGKLKLDKNNQEIEVDGVFIEIGETPQSALFETLEIDRDHGGFVKVHANQRTSVDGIWAAGDSTTNSNKLRQIVTACAEGAVAIVDIYAELRK